MNDESRKSLNQAFFVANEVFGLGDVLLVRERLASMQRFVKPGPNYGVEAIVQVQHRAQIVSGQHEHAAG